jgi:hypothetical protein
LRERQKFCRTNFENQKGVKPITIVARTLVCDSQTKVRAVLNKEKMRLFAKKNVAALIAAFVIGLAAVATVFGLSFYQTQIATVTGKINQFLLGARGEVNGFVLDTGEQVRFSPETGAVVLQFAKTGDEIAATGKAGTKTVYGQAFHAEKLIVNNQTITEIHEPKKGKPHPPKGDKPQPENQPEAQNGDELTASGAIKMFLVTPRGDVDGLILTSGEQLRFSPKVGYQITSANIGSNANVTVAGHGAKTEHGTVIRAEKLTIGNQTFSLN